MSNHRKMLIGIVSPAAANSQSGNGVTARRWAGIFRQLGHTTQIVSTTGEHDFDLLVALHAGKSAAAIKAFRHSFPDRPIVLALTGTDLYGAIDQGESLGSLESADRLIVLQPNGIGRLPFRFRDRTHVIRQSVSLTLHNTAPWHVSPNHFNVALIAHLRDVKDPLLASDAVQHLPADSRIRIHHFGAVLDEELGRLALQRTNANGPYVWHGETPRNAVLAELAACQLLILTSKLEGGANVVSESIALGVPVISTQIDGSVGMLGHDYEGYFPVGDARALADLLRRAETDAPFLGRLQQRVDSLKEQYEPRHELESWRKLLRWAFDPTARSLDHPTQIVCVNPGRGVDDFAADVERGLCSEPRRLSCRYFYDDQGSQLFEEICELPEYYLTRAEREILVDRGRAIASALPAPVVCVELGSGSGVKTRLLCERLLERQSRLIYAPADVSQEALLACQRELQDDGLAIDFLGLRGEYTDALSFLQTEPSLGGPEARLVLWLGSSVGNFERPAAVEFLAGVARRLRPGDWMLIGMDLVKDTRTLERAYDDAQGVTASFNKNLLVRINRQLGGEFDPESFDHRAIYCDRHRRIEMYLVSNRAQTVRIGGLDRTFEFRAGEMIHTENAHKYSVADIAELASESGWMPAAQWFDSKRRFSLNLWRRATGLEVATPSS